MTKDELTKWFLCDEKIMLTVVKSTNMVNKAVKTHSLTCTTGAVLGRAITMGAMMGAKLQKTTLQLSLWEMDQSVEWSRYQGLALW